jgi:hypothetical protein
LLIFAIAMLIANAVFTRVGRERAAPADAGDALAASDTFPATRALPARVEGPTLLAPNATATRVDCGEDLACVARHAEAGDRHARLSLHALLSRASNQADATLRAKARRYLELERDAGNRAALYELSRYWGDGVLVPRDVYRQYVYLYADAQYAPPVIIGRTYAALQRIVGELTPTQRDNAEREGSALFARCCKRDDARRG